MPIYALGSLEPIIDSSAYIHPDAVVIGNVRIGERASIWPGAVLRGDDGAITVGDETSIQDNCVLHTTPMKATEVGARCVVGHLVHLEACTIEDDCLIGNMSMVLHFAVVHSWAIVAANAVVLNNTVVPSGALAVGTPATIKQGRARRTDIELGVRTYIQRAERFQRDLRRID
jgi:carbonic anhydrase/acetyltransferase-like protein (isoleucine patch superfamily)